MERFAPLIILASAVLVFPVLLLVPAPYGRHLRGGFGPLMPARLGWFLMELVSLVGLPLAFCLRSRAIEDPGGRVLAMLFIAHYANRALVFPFLMRGEARRKPVLTVGLAIGFNAVNAWSNGAALEPRALDGRFLAGLFLFAAGAAINLQADAVLRSLRAPGESGYQIPRGGLYRFVSCPNYLGEIVEWAGFALAAGTLPSLAFAVFTFANLAPRAVAHHRWYRARFPDYPPGRKALIPGVW